MKLLTTRSAAFLTLFALCLGGSATIMGKGNDNPNDSSNAPGDLAQAREQFALQNYNAVIEQCRRIVKANPDSDLADEATALIGQSMFGLGEERAAYDILSKLVEQKPTFADRLPVAKTLAWAARDASQPMDVVAKYFEAAFQSAQQAKEQSTAIDLVLDLAEAYDQHEYTIAIEPRENVPQHADRTLVAAVLSLSTFDRALALPANAEQQIRALDGKTTVLVEAGHVIGQIPKELWRPEMKERADLADPYQSAIDNQREIIRRFPDRDESRQAYLDIGEIESQFRRDFVAARKVYEELLKLDPKNEEAQQRHRAIVVPQLAVGVTDIALPDSAIPYQWSARNIKRITLSAHPVDLFEDLRRSEDVFSLHPGRALAAAVAQWTVETGDKGDHQYVASEGPVETPVLPAGAFVIVAKATGTNGEAIEARAMAVASRLALVSKMGKSNGSFFAVDAVTGEPKPNTKLLVQRYLRTVRIPVLNQTKDIFEYLDFAVPDNGLVEVPFRVDADAQQWQHRLQAVARDGDHYAVTNGQYWGGWWGVSDGLYAYAQTDRPIYRPNQAVHFKLTLRSHAKGEYQTLAKEAFTVTIRDAKGAEIYNAQLVSTDAGSVSGQVVLGDEPALGMYSIAVTWGKQGISLGPGASFRVEEYKKPEFKIDVATDKPLFKLGEPMTVRIHGEYYFGGAVPNAKVNYTVHREALHHHIGWYRPFGWFYDDDGRHFHPWWGQHRRDLITQGELTTDAEGNAVFELATEPFPGDPSADVRYVVDVTMVDESRREISASQTINVTRQAFQVSLEPKRYVHQPGDTVRIAVKSENANGLPIPFEGTQTISLVTQREIKDAQGKVATAETLESWRSEKFAVDDRGTGEIEFVADAEGLFKIVVTAPDPFHPTGEAISAEHYVWVAQGTGRNAHYANRDLEIILDQDTVHTGQTLRFLVVSQKPDSYVWLTAEGDELYRSEVLFIKGTQTVVEWPVTSSLSPMVAIKAVTIHDNKIFQEERSVYVPPVEKFLTVKIIAEKEEYRPREEATVRVEVTDSTGQPAPNVEMALGVFDASLLYIQPETRGDIRKFFHGRSRPVTVRTTDSFQFQASMRGRQQTKLGDFYMAPGRMMRRSGMAEDMAMESMPAPMAAPQLKEADELADMPADGVAPTEVRSDFRDTVYWGAHLTTDSAGACQANIRFPDSLTAWRLTAVGADAATRVGEILHEVRTKKKILIRWQTPRFLIEGDTVVLSAIVHNDFDHPVPVRVDLSKQEGLKLLGMNTSQWQDLPSPEKTIDGIATVEIPAHGEQRVDAVYFVERFGPLKLRAEALAKEESDIVEVTVPSFEYGSQKLLAESGTILGSESVRTAQTQLVIPKEIRAGSQSLLVHVSPTIAGVMLESLPYLIEYPYGCTEQTMSRFLPAVLTTHTLRTLGMDLSELANIKSDDPVVQKRLQSFRSNPVYDQAELDKIIKAGVQRLASFQRDDGGWGWWKGGDADAYLTAYVVSGLAVARDAGVSLPAGLLDRGVEYLAAQAVQKEPIKLYPWQKGENLNLRASILHAIARSAPAQFNDKILADRLRDLFVQRDQLTDYGRALLALTLADANMREESLIVLSNVKDRARFDKENGTASWGNARNYFYWYDAGTEATSYSLKALIRLEPNSDMIPAIVRWLVRQRQGTRWYSTKDTAIACDALADYLRMSNELDPDMTIIVDVDGQEAYRARVTKKNLFTFEDEFERVAEDLGTGAKGIAIRVEGRGHLYWGAYARFFTKEEKITEAGHELFITRAYERLVPREVVKTRKVYDQATSAWKEEEYKAIDYDRQPIKEGDPLSSGDLVDVVLTIDAKNNFEYVVIEDPKPAGCEAVDQTSGYRWLDRFSVHAELRDEKGAFFASHIPQGTHRLTYRLRAEAPGQFHALPARAECMHAPLVTGNADSRVIRVVE